MASKKRHQNNTTKLPTPAQSVLKRARYDSVETESDDDSLTSNNWPRFLTVTSTDPSRPVTKLSPFAIHKQILGIAGDPREVEKLKTDKILIECQKKSHSDNLLSIQKIVDIAVKVCPHITLNSSKGVTRSRKLEQCTVEEMSVNLKQQGVSENATVHAVQKHQYATSASTEAQKASVHEVLQHKYATSASIELQPYKLYKLDDSPNTVVDLTREDGLEIFKKMVALREMTNSIKTIYKTGTIRGFCHLTSGQEGCCVGMNAAITDKDAVITAYRTHGWAYLKHIGFHKILSELTGRATGASRGKGGSSHMYNPKFNFFGGNSIVGMQVPLGAGIAFGFKYQQRENICITIYGDGTANQGQVFEAFNIAKLWDIPCIFVCENNGYAISTTPNRASANTRFYTRGDYIPGIWVDGMDVLAVREATRFAKAYVLQNGPIIVELDTYRFDGHSLRDPALTSELKRDTDAMQKEHDPITLFKETMFNNLLADDSDLEKIESEIKGELDEVTKLALTDSALPLDAMYKDIYVDQSEMDVRGVDFSLGRRHSSYPSS